MNIPTIKTLVVILSVLTVNIVRAEQFPLQIDADRSNCGTDLINCVLEGNVSIAQDDVSITADKLFSQSEFSWNLAGNIVIEKDSMRINAESANVSLEEKQLNQVQLLGSPVSFNYLVDDIKQANGQADSVTFQLNQGIISLDGNARLMESGNELAGEHIEYDLNQERFKANAKGDSSGRVKLVFEPPKPTTETSESKSDDNADDD